MALAFVTQQPFVTSNIIGATSLEQLDSNLASFELKLSDEVLAGIEAIHKDHPNPAPYRALSILGPQSPRVTGRSRTRASGR